MIMNMSRPWKAATTTFLCFTGFSFATMVPQDVTNARMVRFSSKISCDKRSKFQSRSKSTKIRTAITGGGEEDGLPEVNCGSVQNDATCDDGHDTNDDTRAIRWYTAMKPSPSFLLTFDPATLVREVTFLFSTGTGVACAALSSAVSVVLRAFVFFPAHVLFGAIVEGWAAVSFMAFKSAYWVVCFGIPWLTCAAPRCLRKWIEISSRYLFAMAFDARMEMEIDECGKWRKKGEIMVLSWPAQAIAFFAISYSTLISIFRNEGDRLVLLSNCTTNPHRFILKNSEYPKKYFHYVH
uniref:Uncharacterized protein n=1 Tax=Corethron hystrix TaxID=216773 RepID=A0A6U5H0M3_9STRA|mmetsp:Transcript_28760/g.65807  ORF Transcript_28760/g.65807 Transcript_28760/m.65807 type:complete len:295 (+) Transcript_28760:176-1060(+)